MKMLKTVPAVVSVFILAAWLATTIQAEASDRPVIIAASGTSYAEGSSSIICLLNPSCQGYWSPRSLDAGSGEGIYLRFKDTTLFNFIEISVEEPLPEALDFQIFLDAHSSQRLGVIREKDQGEDDGHVKIITVHRISDEVDKPITYLVSALLLGKDDEHPQPLDYRGRSVFIKLAPVQTEPKEQTAPKITSIRFFDQRQWPGEPDRQDQSAEPMALELPVPVPAQAEATSTLEPALAYNVSKLFDSQPDMAWSTDGKKSSGVGESILLRFEAEQEIHGLMLWNGYQRSDTHYKANGRVKALRLADQTIRVKDQQGPQIVRLPKPVKAAEVSLEISEIYPGGSYKDVLISEMRFIGPDDQIILPWLPDQTLTLPPELEKVVDRSFVPILHEVGPFDAGPGDCGEGCVYYDSSLRLRSNGSFVIYTYTWGEEGPDQNIVVEGNWEALADGDLRLFGKKYQTSIWSNFSSYLQDDPKARKNKSAAPRIFQSVTRVGWFASLPPAEQENAVRYMLQAKWSNNYGLEEYKKGLPDDVQTGILMHAEGEMVILGGKDRDTAVKNIIASLNELNPLYVKSDIFTEMLLLRQTRHFGE